MPRAARNSAILSTVCGMTLALAWSAQPLRSQVSLSEIDFATRSGAGPWVEITNRGSTTVDLSNWSLYYESTTANTPRNYWWGFPSGTKIDAGKFLRVHWFVDRKPATATDLYTGKTLFDFLFGLWAEPLSSSSGAMALMATQRANEVNQATFMRDWVQWGATGFRRSTLASQAGIWTANTSAAGNNAATPPSLAYDYRSNNGRRDGSMWFRDETPTPLTENLGGASLAFFGAPCRGGIKTAPDLRAIGLPVLGNRGFALRASRGTVSGEVAVAFFNPRGPGLLRLAGCPYYLDPSGPALSAIMLPDSSGLPTLGFNTTPDRVIAGIKITTQWAFINVTPFAGGMTRAIELQFGSR